MGEKGKGIVTMGLGTAGMMNWAWLGEQMMLHNKFLRLTGQLPLLKVLEVVKEAAKVTSVVELQHAGTPLNEGQATRPAPWHGDQYIVYYVGKG